MLYFFYKNNHFWWSMLKSRSMSNLILVQDDPLKRLGEFCKKGGYYYNMRWDNFSNGVMMVCQVFHIRRRDMLCREVRFIENPKSITEAKKVISAVLLQNIGLGVSEDSEEQPDSPERSENSETFSDCSSQKEDLYKGMAGDMGKMGMDILTKVLSDMNQPKKVDPVPGFTCDNFRETLMKSGLDENLIDDVSNITKLLNPTPYKECKSKNE